MDLDIVFPPLVRAVAALRAGRGEAMVTGVVLGE
jgi:hypothetical protein